MRSNLNEMETQVASIAKRFYGTPEEIAKNVKSSLMRWGFNPDEDAIDKAIYAVILKK